MTDQEITAARRLWIYGNDTKKIAYHLQLPEYAIYNNLYLIKRTGNK